MRVGIIGCGAAGLVAAKHSLDSGFETVVLERSHVIGGTWVYCEEETDRHGLPSHSSMYKNLKTNLPKELMEFQDLHYNLKNDISYLPAEDVIDYLNRYTDCFNIRPHVKFEHYVKRVRPIEDDQWEATVWDLNTNQEASYLFDALFVCNGHYSIPSYPELKGSDVFEGLQIHSHFYKTPETFKDLTVLIIGIGPSGQDITCDLAPYSKKIYLSHHSDHHLKNSFSLNVIHKPDVSRLTRNTVVFVDGSEDDIDAVLYCTGYVYAFPFMDKDCGLQVEENYVKPLYKQLINIHHPTMALIGLPFKTFIFPLFELQVKCFVSLLLGRVTLPTRREMLEETVIFEENQKVSGRRLKEYHMLSEQVKAYCDALSETFSVDNVPLVQFLVLAASTQRRYDDLSTYRNQVFSIVDESNFTVRDLGSSLGNIPHPNL